MSLFLDTTGADVVISELGITISHPTTDFEITDQFEAEEIRSAESLTTAIQNGDLNWKKSSGGPIENGADYDPDYAEVVELATATQEANRVVRVTNDPSNGQVPVYNSGDWLAEDLTADDILGVDIVNTSPLTITTSWQDIPLNFERIKDSIFTHAANSAEITVTQSGRYIVEYSLGTQSTSGATRSQTEGRLVLNGSAVANSNSEIYNRTSSEGGGHAHRSFILDLNANDVLKIQVQRQSGGNTQQTIAGASALVIHESKGPKGDKGDKGDPGIGSTIAVEDDNVSVGSPFDTLNFGSGLTATDDGGGQVTIETTAPTFKYRQYMQFMQLDILNFDQYLTAYRDDGDDPRSGSASNGFQFQSAGPILNIHTGSIIKANFAIKGVAISTGSPAATVTVRFEIWSVGFNGQGTKLADVDLPISSTSFTIGSFNNSFVDTNFKGSVALSVPVTENDLIGVKFDSRTGAANAVEIREVVCTLTSEEA